MKTSASWLILMVVLLFGLCSSFPAAAAYNSPYDQPGDNVTMLYAYQWNGVSELDRIGGLSNMTTDHHFVSTLLNHVTGHYDAKTEGWTLADATESIVASVVTVNGVKLYKWVRRQIGHAGADVVYFKYSTHAPYSHNDTLHRPMAQTFVQALGEFMANLQQYQKTHPGVMGFDASCGDKQASGSITITLTIIGFIVAASNPISSMWAFAVGAGVALNTIHTQMQTIHDACTGSYNPFPPGGGPKVQGA